MMTMKFLLSCILAMVPLTLSLELSEDESFQWELFQVQHNKIYDSTEEQNMRRSIFIHNLRHIREHNVMYNRGEVSYEVEINSLADMTLDDMISRKGLRQSDEVIRSGKTYYEPDGAELPDSVDWRTKGAVTGVKNQGQCGSCWAFSATGSLEGQHFLKTKKLVSLSEQNLVDCSDKNFGCEGGYPSQAFNYIKINKGIDTEESYPYEANDGTCRYNPENIGATDEGYVSLPEGDEGKLQSAVATKGPISVAIDASADSFRFYKQGVYSEKNCSTAHLDHAVLAVGYGTTKSGEDYWLIKNSWGKSWGMDGYMMMARNKNNMCGIATEATYPIV